MGIFEAATVAANVLKEAGKIEEYKQILQLLDRLLELQKRVADLETENKSLKEKFELKEKLEYKHNSYWIDVEGPYCSRCWEKNRDLMRMHLGWNNNYARCPECKASVNFTGKEDSFPTSY